MGKTKVDTTAYEKTIFGCFQGPNRPGSAQRNQAGSRLYHVPRSAREQEIRIQHRLDEWYTKRPCLGSRKLVILLAAEGIVARRHTLRHYRAEMRLFTLYPKPNLLRPSRVKHRVYPYLLRGLSIERPDQVWGVGISPIKPHLHPLAERLFVSGGVLGLVLAAGCVLAAGAQVSRDGRGRYVDNIFTERLWRTVKYEGVYLADYETPKEARTGLSS
jgi:putative transposase